MHHVEAPVELVGLAEEKEDRAGLEAVIGVLDPAEEDQFHRSALILHHYAQLLALDLRGDHLGEDLDVGACGLDRGDALDRASVDVAEREGAQKVTDSGHTEF